MINNVLEEIAEWKLEAKLEDNDRYFYHISDLRRIEKGSHCYIIGRKGTGKTAMSEYLLRQRDPKIFSVKLSFKNFPFNELYKLENKSFSHPNQYITLWKYLIYSHVAKSFIDNENINLGIRNELAKVYPDDVGSSLARTLMHLTGKNFDISFVGLKLAKGTVQTPIINEVSWIEKVELLEKLILNFIDDSSYRIIFDELDEDYHNILLPSKHDQYIALLTSLFKAVQDIKSVFPSNRFSLLPIIFLRDDIYSLTTDSDKTKWSDLLIDLDWNQETIKNLLAFRISRAIDSESTPFRFGEAWDRVFLPNSVSIGHKQQKKLTIFDYITRSSQIRPRDYIRYMKICAEATILKGGIIISQSTVKRMDKAFSNYLRSELEDEIRGFLPEIREIIDVLSLVRKQTFSIKEFTGIYKSEIKQGTVKESNIEFILKTLFYFSVIGNQPAQRNTQVFRYLNKEARLNLNEYICVHRGLYKALQLF
jgi:hypothetical protein